MIWVAWGVLVAQQLADAWLHQAPWIVWLAYCLPLLIFLVVAFYGLRWVERR